MEVCRELRTGPRAILEVVISPASAPRPTDAIPGEPTRIGELLPQLLARYGLAEDRGRESGSRLLTPSA